MYCLTENKLSGFRYEGLFGAGGFPCLATQLKRPGGCDIVDAAHRIAVDPRLCGYRDTTIDRLAGMKTMPNKDDIPLYHLGMIII